MKRFIYIFIQLTWGLLATLMGAFVALYALLFKKGRACKNHYGCLIVFGRYWGGLSLGLFQFCDKECTKYQTSFYFTRSHEYGHSLQNAILGPFYIFVVLIPSAIRYHLDSKGKLKRGYYDIWFEKYASSWGDNAMKDD